MIGPDGRPLRGVRIEVVAPPATFDAVYSDETGAYFAPLPSTDRYTLRLAKGGYVTQRVDEATFDPNAYKGEIEKLVRRPLEILR